MTGLRRNHPAQRMLRERDGAVARLERLLEGARVAAMLVGPDLLLIEASPDARALLDRRDGLSLRAGRLAARDPALADALRQAVNRTLRRLPVARATFLCPRPSGAPPWRLLVLPLAGEGGAGCAIVIGGGEPPADRVRLWLAQHYGATPAEIATAEALLAGLTPEEIGAARRVTINTVRTQIRRLIEKTDTRGISQLVVLLARLS